MTRPDPDQPPHAARQSSGGRTPQPQAPNGQHPPRPPAGETPGATDGETGQDASGHRRRPRPAPVPDEAPTGDIEGALGRIRAGTGPPPGWRARLVAFLAIVGPGLIVMVGDNDAGGVATYSAAGQNYGYSLLWTLLALVPVLIVNQEMAVRLGVVTGVGHARLITERFGRLWGWFSAGDLFALNFLTIVTEFIGVALALAYFGVSRYLAVPVAAAVLVAITVTGSFRRWERAMLAFIGTSLALFPLAFLSHVRAGAAGYHLFVPGVQGGVTSEAVLLIIAIVGTTVAPWQLFFQQSSVIDKRITPRFMWYERADTYLGSAITELGAAAFVLIAAYAVRGTALAGHFTDALGVAHALARHGYLLGAVFSIVLLDASIIGAAAVTMATSYAFGDMFGIRNSLHRKFREARPFYASYTALVLVAAAVVLIPAAPLGLITTGVQALAGVLLPSATVFLLLLCNDPEVLGPWVNHRWLNTVAAVILAALLVLSGTLVITTVFSRLNAGVVALWLAAALAVLVASAAGWLKMKRARHGAPPRAVRVPREQRAAWRMPPLAMLKPVTWSPRTKLAMIVLRAYLVVAMLLLIVKAVQLAAG